MSIRIKRVYESPATEDGVRILVDGLWPRGISKEKLQAATWMKEIAPSAAIRNQFHHEVPKWDEFKAAYFAELDAKPVSVNTLLTYARQGSLTLLFSARETEHNNAVALKEYLEKHS